MTGLGMTADELIEADTIATGADITMAKARVTALHQVAGISEG